MNTTSERLSTTSYCRTNNRPDIFDRKLLIKRSRLHKGKKVNFLADLAAKNLAQRIDIIKNRPSPFIFNGCKIPIPEENWITVGTTPGNDVFADEELLPFADACAGSFISNLELHKINDLPGCLIRIHNILKPGGVFIASMFGGSTLWQLRESLMRAEITLRGGACPRIYPFTDYRQLGSLLQRAGFEIPVVDIEKITVCYDNLSALLHDLRYMGESNILTARDKRYPGKDLFKTAEEIYRNEFASGDGRIEANFEILYLTGWKENYTDLHSYS